jgi:hypothetical protein
MFVAISMNKKVLHAISIAHFAPVHVDSLDYKTSSNNSVISLNISICQMQKLQGGEE